MRVCKATARSASHLRSNATTWTPLANHMARRWQSTAKADGGGAHWQSPEKRVLIWLASARHSEPRASCTNEDRQLANKLTAATCSLGVAASRRVATARAGAGARARLAHRSTLGALSSSAFDGDDDLIRSCTAARVMTRLRLDLPTKVCAVVANTRPGNRRLCRANLLIRHCERVPIVPHIADGSGNCLLGLSFCAECWRIPCSKSNL